MELCRLICPVIRGRPPHSNSVEFPKGLWKSAPSRLKLLPRRKNEGRKQVKQACFFSQMKLSGRFVYSVGGENIKGRYLRKNFPP